MHSRIGVITCKKILSLKLPRHAELLFGSLRTLSTVLGTGLHSAVDALCIERSADDVVTHTGKVLNTAAADENNRVLLKVMTDARDISRNLDAVGKTNSGDLSKSRVGLLGGGGLNRCANTALLRRSSVGHDIFLGVETLQKRGGFGFLLKSFSSVSHKLIKRWQAVHLLSEIYI